MTNFNGWRNVSVILLLCAATAIASPAQTFTNLANFDITDGAFPNYMSLIQGANGNYYGTTIEGGFYNEGTVFKMTPGGTVTVVYSFCAQTACTDGSIPYAGLVLATNGDFYGTTSTGGTNNDGTVFKLTSAGILTTLHSFDSTDGATPGGPLVQATNGNFYGTTRLGGAGSCNCGTVFEITAAGVLTTLHSFVGTFPEGGYPYGGLVQAANGDLYGTTLAGEAGSFAVGSFFRITLGGTLTTLYAFSSTGNSGANPYDKLVQGANGDFYGTAAVNGENTQGTVFRLTPAGVLTTLHSFAGTDGAQPEAGLVLATDGNFYGTTDAGGTNNLGTIFKITPSGTFTSLHSFDNTDGAMPTGGLMQATNGTLYGTTYEGGTGDGTVFSLSENLGAFVEIQPTSGKEGIKISILGQGFTPSSIVKFGGVQATTVTRAGSTLLTATVPTGALTGSVTVTTGSTTLTSNQKFLVTPQILSFSPPSGPVGTSVTINGTGLMQTTKVAFNGVVATTFTVNSDSQVTADVPVGATTGKIAIVTNGGSAASAASFTVN